MADHLPENLVRGEEIDDILAGICDEPCAVQDVASGCSCAMARQIVKNLQMTAVNHLGQIERLRAAADGVRREGRDQGINEAVARLALWELGAIGEEITFAEHAIKIVTALLFTPPQPDPVAAAREAVATATMTEYRSSIRGWTLAMMEACAALAALEKGDG